MTTTSSTIGTGTSAFYDRAKTDFATLRDRADTLQTQLSTGLAITRSSDDPVAASRLRALQRADQLAKIDTANVSRANADLSLTDSALTGMSNYIARARELAVHASSSTLSDDERSAISEELSQIRTGVLSLANAHDSQGFALFGGGASGDAYTVDASGNATYAGTTDAVEVPIGDGQSIAKGVTGPDVLGFTSGGSTTDLLAVLKNLSDAVKPGATDPSGSANAALTSLDAGLASVTAQQTIVGTRMNWLDAMSDRATTQTEQRKSEESDVGGVDIASTTVDLQRAMLVLQASQASFTKLSSLTLFNVS